MPKEKYTEEQIDNAVAKCVESWEMDALVMYAKRKLREECMDRSRPIYQIDNLMHRFGS